MTRGRIRELWLAGKLSDGQMLSALGQNLHNYAKARRVGNRWISQRTPYVGRTRR